MHIFKINMKMDVTQRWLNETNSLPNINICIFKIFYAAKFYIRIYYIYKEYLTNMLLIFNDVNVSYN